MSKKPAPPENKAMPGPPENKAPADAWNGPLNADGSPAAIETLTISSPPTDTPAPTVKPRTFGFLRPKE